MALQGWQNFRGGLDVKSESYISTSSLCILQGHTPFIFNTSLEAFSIWSLHMYKGIIYEALWSCNAFQCVCYLSSYSVVCMLLPASEMCVCLLYCREHNRSHECVHGV